MFDAPTYRRIQRLDSCSCCFVNFLIDEPTGNELFSKIVKNSPVVEEESDDIVVVGVPGRRLGGDNEVEVIQGQVLDALGDGDVLEVFMVPLMEGTIDW